QRTGIRLTLDWLTWTFAGTRISLRTLTPQGETFAMTQTAVATEVHQSLDAHIHFTAQVTFNSMFRDLVANGVKLLFAESRYLGVFGNTCRSTNLLGGGKTYSENIGEGNHRMFVIRYIDAGNTGHSFYSNCLLLL